MTHKGQRMLFGTTPRVGIEGVAWTQTPTIVGRPLGLGTSGHASHHWRRGGGNNGCAGRGSADEGGKGAVVVVTAVSMLEYH